MCPFTKGAARCMDACLDSHLKAWQLVSRINRLMMSSEMRTRCGDEEQASVWRGQGEVEVGIGTVWRTLLAM